MKTDDVLVAAAAAHLRQAPPLAIVPPNGDSAEGPALFDLPDLPTFPVDALPTWIGTMVEAVALETETPADVAAMLSLSVLATACARRMVVEPRSGHVEQLCLYTISALPSGSRKSGVFKRIIAPVQAFEKELIKREAPRVAAETHKREVTEERLAAIKRDLAKADDREHVTGLTLELEQITAHLEENPAPKKPQLIVSDVTTEKLGMLLGDHGRIAVLDEEGGLFETMAGRYAKAGAGPNIDPYLKGHDGGDLRVGRVERDSFIAERPVLTIGMTVQPQVLNGLGDKSGFRGRGLTARFLYCIPQSRMGSRNLDTPPTPADVIAYYNTGVRALLELPDPGDEPHRLVFSQEARAEWLAFARSIEPRRAPRGDLGNMADWASKLDGAVARIAGLLHAAECPQAPWTVEVPAETVARAVRIGTYLIEHARAAYGGFGTDEVAEQAQRVVEWIRRKKLRSFTLRDALRGELKGLEHKKAMEPVLESLTHRGIISPVEQGTGERGGRPTTIYRVASEVLR
jgi:replicative DNA helicase